VDRHVAVCISFLYGKDSVAGNLRKLGRKEGEELMCCVLRASLDV
jgi:hypothetical protein